MTTITELGCPGHFIGAKRCNWRRHTQVGNKYRVSTVGNLYWDKDKERQTLGAGEDDFFETMVFETLPQDDFDNDGCGCLAVKDWCDIDGNRWATAGEAQAGHEEFVRKYADKTND